jgi:hypothetical protein
VQSVNHSYPAELSLLVLGAFQMKYIFLNPANVTTIMHVSEQKAFAGTGNIVGTKDVRILQLIMNVLWDMSFVYKIHTFLGWFGACDW